MIHASDVGSEAIMVKLNWQPHIAIAKEFREPAVLCVIGFDSQGGSMPSGRLCANRLAGICHGCTDYGRGKQDVHVPEPIEGRQRRLRAGPGDRLGIGEADLVVVARACISSAGRPVAASMRAAVKSWMRR